MSAPDWQPTLTGPTLHLRPLRATDFDALFAVASDPEIWAQHPARDRYQEAVFRKLFEDGLASGGAILVTDRVSGEVLGSTRFYNWVPERREIEIGYTFLKRSRWGGATNRELKTLVLGHALTFAAVAVFIVAKENLRSRRAMEKIGGRLLPERTEVEGHVVYAMGPAELGALQGR